MADYIDPGLAIKKLAANVKGKMAGKIDKPSDQTGQLVYNATTNTWEAAPVGGGGNDLLLTWDHAALVWRALDGTAMTATTHPVWADYTNITADASTAVTADEVDLSVLPSGVTPIMSMAVASTADPIQTVAAAAPTVTYADLRVV